MGNSISSISIDSISDIYSKLRPISGDFTGVDSYMQLIEEMASKNFEIPKSILSDLNFLEKLEVIPSWSGIIKDVSIPHKEEDSDYTVNTAGESIKNVSTDSTNSIDINYINEDFYKFLDKHTAVFIWTLKHTDFEDGIENAPIKEVKNYIRKNRFVTFSWLHSIYSNNQKDSDIISALLRIIGMTVDNEDYDKLLPLVKAGLLDNSSKAQEAALMVIEQWRSKNCLDAIQTAQFKSQWIREYAKQIELELKKELESC